MNKGLIAAIDDSCNDGSKLNTPDTDVLSLSGSRSFLASLHSRDSPKILEIQEQTRSRQRMKGMLGNI